MVIIKTHENLYKNVNENMFSFTFLCKILCICNFGIFVPIFMKLSPKCRTKELGMNMVCTIFGSFCSFLNWEGADIWPQIRPRKIPGHALTHSLTASSEPLAQIKNIFQQIFLLKPQFTKIAQNVLLLPNKMAARAKNRKLEDPDEM